MPHSISVAMIVQDELSHLAESLSCITGLADELCIVDTGSRDNTVEIAREFKAKVSYFIWCDDYSAARNESLRRCTRDWVLVLDASERIAPEDLQRVRALADGSLSTCYRFTTRHYTNTQSVGDFHPCEPDTPHIGGFAGWYPSQRVRLFPNNSGARFEGKVHEVIMSSLEARGIQVVESDIPIHHYPYTRGLERILAKPELALEPGQDMPAENPDDPRALVALGNQYADAGDHARAVAAYHRAFERDPSNVAALKELGNALHLLRRSEEAKRVLWLALELDPALVEAWRNIGLVYADEKEWDLAIECFEQGIARAPSWIAGYRYLSVAFENAGRAEDAAAAARTALDADPSAARSVQLYVHQMLRIEQRAEARAFLESLIRSGRAQAGSPSGAPNAELHNAIGELCYYDDLHEEAIVHFLVAANAGNPQAYNNLGIVYYRQQRFQRAKEAFENCLAVAPGHRGAQVNLAKAMDRLEGKEPGASPPPP